MIECNNTRPLRESCGTRVIQCLGFTAAKVSGQTIMAKNLDQKDP